ncbi:MAG: hypothetical protein RBS05_01055 [Zoogloea oleivorans]|nr:hypothetical protein [Zoogloea oleivorans]
MGIGNWSLSPSLNTPQTHEQQRKTVRIAQLMRRSVPLMAAGLFALGLVLLLSGFSSVPPTDAAKSATGAGAWQELAEDLVKRASTFQVMAELGDSEPSAKLAIETQVAFENNKDRLKPDYARFLADITLILQIKPDVHVTITGFGNNPATNYNPVLLGKRVRAVQVFFAENGIPMEQIEAGVKEADEYEGPNTLLGKASSGQLITVHFAQT